MHEVLLQNLSSDFETLKKAQELAEWRFMQAELEGAERIEFDGSSWKKLKANHMWSTAAGTVWLRKELIFPILSF